MIPDPVDISLVHDAESYDVHEKCFNASFEHCILFISFFDLLRCSIYDFYFQDRGRQRQEGQEKERFVLSAKRRAGSHPP